MTKYKIVTPNVSFNGTRYGVSFEKGEAIAELTEHVAQEFQEWGYLVEKLEEETPKKTTTRKTTAKKATTKE